jgi:hypothetical protein
LEQRHVHGDDGLLGVQVLVGQAAQLAAAEPAQQRAAVRASS